MSATEIIEQMRNLPVEQKREVVEQIWAEFGDEIGWVNPDLTSEQIAELDRRAEEALNNPGRGTPWEQIRDEMLRKYRK